MVNTKKKMKCISLQEKVAIMELVRSGKSHSAVAKEYGVTRQCVSKILAKKSEILNNYEKRDPAQKRVRPLKFKKIDEALLTWFKAQHNITIGGQLLLKKASEFAEKFSIPDFSASNGWLEKWKKRHQISLKLRAVSNEATSVNIENNVTQEEYVMLYNQFVTTSEKPSENEMLTSSVVDESDKNLHEMDDNGESHGDISGVKPAKVTVTDYLNSLETVRLYLLQQPEPQYEKINFVLTLEVEAYRASQQSRHQKQVTDYFSPVK